MTPPKRRRTSTVSYTHLDVYKRQLPEVLELAASGRLGEARMKLFYPLGFMLASPVETVEEALQRFSNEVAEEAKSASSEARPDGCLLYTSRCV